MPQPRFPFSICALIFGALLALAPRTEAASARASLSSDVMTEGDAISFSINIAGARNVQPPQRIDVDGLEINYSGYAQRTEFSNGKMDATVDITYTLQALQRGNYTIPAIEVKTEAGVLRTEPLKLSVRAASNAPPGNGGAASPGDGSDARGPAEYAEITLGKTSAYVGENVPVEVRLLADVESRARPEQMPELTGEGFTKQKFLRPREERARRNGREYQVVVFRTVVCPSRAGKITLGPSVLKYVASVPRAKRARSSDPFESFFNDPFGPFTQTQERQTTAAAVELEVKPLPTNGRPKSFSGAVGKFKFSAEGSPRQVKVGDPITMKMRVNGKGNFDRLSEPALLDPQGWHAYPASAEFSPDDELSMSGTKKFEVAVVPEVQKTAMPVFEFSYFDPEAAKYVTLTSESAPLAVTGAPASPAPIPAPPASAGDEAPPVAAPIPAAADILGIRYEFGERRPSFEPIYRTRNFWLAQIVPAFGLIGLLALRRLRRRSTDTAASTLRRERAELWRRLQGNLDDTTFLETGTRWVQIETALRTGLSADAVDGMAVRRLVKDEEIAAAIEELFHARGELLFAGAGRGQTGLSADSRQRFLQALTRFQSAHEKA